jgi:lipoate---protein ligase
MLISTRLDTLGDLLRVNKVGAFLFARTICADSMQPTLVTKGVASVRSPVRNLQQYNPGITHEAFVEAVVCAFREHYNIQEEVKFCRIPPLSRSAHISHSGAAC